MESLDVVKFGIFDDFSHVFGTGSITNIVPLNHREMIISTTKEIIKIERNIIKMRHPIKFSTCAIVPDTDFLIGVTTKRGDLVIYQIGDLPQTMQSYNSRSVILPPPLLENYPTNQSGIFHMIYSPKSQSIITIGAGIKVFHLQYKLSRISVVKPTVSISHRSSFASDYATTILVPPAFETESELILLPTDEGICAYNLDGEKIMQCSKFPASLSTVYATHPSKPPKLAEIPTDGKEKKQTTMTKKLLTYDSNKGLALWGKRGQLIDQFDTIGSSVLAIMFVDSENALCLNSAHTLFFLNIKTGKTFFCLNLEKNPSRIFLTFVNKQPILSACFSSYMRALKIVIPWRVWNLNIDNAFLLCRCNKYCSAARVLIDAENAFIKLYSPRDGGKMTVATPAEAVHSVSFLYDRGIFENYVFDEKNLKYDVKVMKITSNEEKTKNNENEEEENAEKNNGRDILFIILENGTILGFDTNVANCEEVMKMKCKAAFMSICRIRTIKKQRQKNKNNQVDVDEEETEKINYQWCYAVASEKSDLFILDYFSMKEVRHFTVSDDKLIKMFYHFDSECIIMVFERKTIMFDIEKGKIISMVKVAGSEITSMFANFLFYGYESGHMRRVSIENKQFVLVSNKRKKKKETEENENENEDMNEDMPVSYDNGKSNSNLQKPHDGPITGFSFSQKIWISSGLDGNIIVWDYNFETVYKIVLPLPLRACLIMNGKRDILVATNTEVMQIKDSYLLDYFEDDPYDVEIKEIDNFDRIKDALCHDSIEAFDPDAYDNINMSDVLSDEDEEEENENEKNKKNNKKFDLPNISKKASTNPSPSKPPAAATTTSTNDSQKENKTNNKKPSEDSKEDVQKKLEMMQAMNGLGSSNVSHPPPSSSTTTTSHAAASPSSKESSPKKAETKPPEKKKEEPKENKKETETKKKKPPKEGKELSDFINSNMENEKAQNKKKKVKKNNNQEKEQVKDEGPKKSEEEVANMIGNLFDRNKPKNQANTNKKKASGEGIDFNELAKKFHKDEDPLVVNLDKADLSKKDKNNNENDDNDDDDDDEGSENESSQKKKPSNQTTKPKQSSNATSKPNTNTKPSSNTAPKEKENKSNTNTKSNANAKPKEKEKEKEKTKTNVVPTEKENKTSNNNNKANKEKKPAKSSSSSKPQKESPKNTSKPQESKTNENKVNNSPKKTKQSSPTKSSSNANTKPISNSNTNNNNSSYNPNSTSTSSPSKAATSNLNPSSNNNYNNNNNNNSNKINDKPISNTLSSSNPNDRSFSGTKSDNKSSNLPQTQNNNNINNNDNNNNNNNNNSTSTPYGKSNKVSIGTQGEQFDNDNKEDQNNDPENTVNKDNDDSIHLEVKMNGPNPLQPSSTSDLNAGQPTANNNNDENEPPNVNDENDANDDQTVVNSASNEDINNSQIQNEADDTPDTNLVQNDNKSDTQPPPSTISNTPKDDQKSSEKDDHLDDQPTDQQEAANRSESDASNHQRAPTPPPIRPQLTSPDTNEIERRVSNRRRPRTPPPKRERPPTEFQMPPPNVIIDQEAVLVLYGRGRLEFKPLVDRIQRDMMIAGQGVNNNGDYYTQKRRITLAYVQNYGEEMKKNGNQNENENEGKKFSKTAQQVVPPLKTPHRSIGHYYDPDPVQFTGEKSIFNGCTNGVSPAFKHFRGVDFSSTYSPSVKSGVDIFNVTIEKGDEKANQIRHNRLFTPDFQHSFSPAAYVYNYEKDTETVFNDIDTRSSITTPRKVQSGEVTGNDSKDDDVIGTDSKSQLKSPRRIQSARAVGRPMFSPSVKEPQVKMPLPLSPIVMASPRRSFNNNSSKKRPPLLDASVHSEDAVDGEEEGEIPVDQLESAVMIKMPKLHLTSSASPSPRQQFQSQFQPSPNVQPNFGQSQNFNTRPNSVRTFDRSPLVFNQPIGAGMLKPGSLKKRNASFYANVAVTTSISNARRSSPAYRTGSSRSTRQVGQNNRKGVVDGYAGLTKTPPNEIEITVK